MTPSPGLTPEAAMSALPGYLGPYRVLRRLAYGGMAEVLLAQLSGADGFARKVVIKRVLPQHCSNIEFLTMFRDEARITAQLHHGNIVQVVEFGVDREQHYLVLEYVDGPSLAGVLSALARRGQLLSIAEVSHIIAEMARALDYAHRKKGSDGKVLEVVHRDVSPSNILISNEGEVKLADFGIARARARLLPTTQAYGIVKGKLAYSAPEAFLTGRVDSRSDIFALGVVAYEALSGQRPFHAETEAATLGRLLAGKSTPPSEYRSDIPEVLSSLVQRMLQVDPVHRPSRALEISHELGAIINSSSTPPEEALATTIASLYEKEAIGGRPTTRPGTLRRPKVLVVDNSRTMQAILSTFLSARYTVLRASSGEEALDALARESPCAVVCQRLLPELSGLELCQRVRAMQELGGIPFVLLSADVTPALRREARGCGVSQVLGKNVDGSTIDRILRNLLSRQTKEESSA